MKDVIQLAAVGLLAGLFVTAIASPPLAALLSVSIHGFTNLLSTITRG